MDQLTKDAIAAQKAGLSYGQYMARKPQPEPVVRKKKKTGAEKEADSSTALGMTRDEVTK